MTLSEEIALQAEAATFGVEYNLNNPESTKGKIEAVKSSVVALEARAREIGVYESTIRKCNGNIPCLLKAIDLIYSEIARKTIDEEIKKQEAQKSQNYRSSMRR